LSYERRFGVIECSDRPSRAAERTAPRLLS